MNNINEPESILIIRYSALGDTLLTLPVLQELKTRFPSCRIDFVTRSALVPLLKATGLVRRTFVLEDEKHTFPEKEMKYSLLIDFQNKLKSRRFSRQVSFEDKRIFKKRSVVEWLSPLWGKHPVQANPHIVQAYLECTFDAPWPGPLPPYPQLNIPADIAQRTERFLQKHNPDRLPLLALGPFTPIKTKRWPLNRYLEAARRLQDQGWFILWVGTAHELEQLRDSERSGRTHASLDGFNLLELSYALKRSLLMVCNDSGPAHLASLVNTPTLTIFGPTPPTRWHPQGAKNKVIRHILDCSPCRNHGSAKCPVNTHACMEQIEVDEVLATIADMR